MGLLDILLHLANFAAPALVPALLLPSVGRLLFGPARTAPPWRTQVALNFVCGVLALGAALLAFGRDGKMAAYGVLVLAVAASQWLLLRGWRR